ncbi:sensor histidine kinase [Paeniglutamicibacter sp. R2-26]|uniref:sensor histidine kinase n=1 Tax=Paeniglutamicibacter sp. R2-26 TaxID=3144417 RepID=UPI003EE4B941
MSKRSDARIRELLASMAGVSSDLDVDTVARRLLEEAMKIFGASAGLLELTDATAAEGRLVRGKDASALDGEAGREEGRRLRVELKTRDRPLGRLTLGPKNGKDRYSRVDRGLAEALAGAAGVALENAQLYRDAADRVRWLEASSRIGELLGGDERQPRGLDGVAELACREARARYGLVLTPVDEAGAPLHAYRIAGISAQVHPNLSGRILHDAGRILAGFREPDPLILPGPEQVLPLGELSDGGHTLLTELSAHGTHYGILVAVRGKGQPAYRAAETQMAALFGSNIAQGLGLARMHHLHEDLRLYLERERIARDLHDVVIQRIFAAGLSISALGKHLPTAATRERAAGITRELDTTIAELRATIYSLRAGAGERELPSSRILRAVRLACEPLDFTPQVRIGDAVDALEDQTLLTDLLAVVTESLSNAVRHSRAGSLAIDVSIRPLHGPEPTGTALVLHVVDDGIGITGPVAESGVANMRQRALERGGALALDPTPGGGTTLRWSVPLS